MTNGEKLFLSGNEAIALGAYESGVTVGAAYPGTPSTEIIESLKDYPGVNCEWSINEKVAVEVAYGAAISGARAIAAMKHVGINVAADPIFTASYTGIKGGMVIVTADDPGMHSSQNEQDNRHYARSAKIPMLEPADPEEARVFTKLAFELSEKHDTPVFLRTTTRLSHSHGIVTGGHRKEIAAEGFSVDSPKYVMIPLNAKKRRVILEERMKRIRSEADDLDINYIEWGKDRKTGFITSGIPYMYVKDAYPDASVLKLGMVYPLPGKLIREFCSGVEEVFVVEELDPFFEEQIKAMGIKVKGKDVFSCIGELSQEAVCAGVEKKVFAPEIKTEFKIPGRPPSLCAGCPHRNIYEVLRDLKLRVSGDIGCYSLGTLPPFNAMHTLLDMGASITMAQGMELAESGRNPGDIVAILGDSTFAHSGLTGIMNAVYNGRKTLTIVVDNGTTAMTGMQPNPFSGETISGEKAYSIDYVKFGEAAGLDKENIIIADAYDRVCIEASLKRLLICGKASLLVVKGKCVILNRKKNSEKQVAGNEKK